MSPFDVVALAVFLTFWMFYERLLPYLVGKRGALNVHMVQIRKLWMWQISNRPVRIADGQFIGHTLNSAAFFGSANLIVMAAVIGVMFGGETAYRSVAGLQFVQLQNHWLFEVKLMMVVATLSRGILDFVWSIRQLNYCLAAIGAMPDHQPDDLRRAWSEAIGTLINPAMSTFSRGVRGYYFSLASAAWLFGPTALLLATIGAVSLLAWRQSRSGAADGVRKVWQLVAQSQAAEAERAAQADKPEAGQPTP
ncbi:MAG TPA: DUF599 family protein [Pedomonas sp.]|uniref:DUF599 domain-containing protein n=1 Tax=Pedomonas sp. TaxID=2976421 RepID=UPI002F3E37A7